MDEVPLDSHSIAVNWPTFLQMTGLYTFHARGRAERAVVGGVLNNFVILLSIKQRGLLSRPASQSVSRATGPQRTRPRFRRIYCFPWVLAGHRITRWLRCDSRACIFIPRLKLEMVYCGANMLPKITGEDSHVFWNIIRINVLQVLQCRHRVRESPFVPFLIKNSTFALSAVSLCWWPTRDNIDMEKNFRNNLKL